jgi:hypothetical protein
MREKKRVRLPARKPSQAGNHVSCLVASAKLFLCVLRCSSLAAQGQAGNAVQYITRNQALKKLQLKLSEFRWRLHANYCSCWSFALLHSLHRASNRHHMNRLFAYAGGCAS